MIEAEANKLTSPVITGDEQADAQALRDSHLYKKALLKWANQTKCLKGMSNMLIVASSDPRIACYRSDFDKQPYLLNSWNGVIDLRTGKLLPHDPALMLSQLCPTEYHKDATHPMWNESLSAFTRKHPDVRDFLQRVFGYAIQSRKSEERIFDFRGDGGSGKGTLFTWIHATLGSDYCITMSPDSITAHKRNAAGPSSDLVRLAGKRIVIVSELEKHNKMQEGFLKAVSGGDRLVARGLNQSEIEIQPTYQFFIQTNYAPRFDAQDTGNQRRYLSVPFRNVLAQDPLVKFEKGLKARMSEDASFKQAVLAWAVKGSIDWHKNGLPICASVQEATKQLFKQNDFLGEFLEDCIQITKNPEDMVPIAQLRKSYEGWCQEQGEEPASGRVFNTMIEERGFRQKNTRNKTTGLKGRQWLGLRIKLPYDAPSRKTETFDKLREVVQ